MFGFPTDAVLVVLVYIVLFLGYVARDGRRGGRFHKLPFGFRSVRGRWAGGVMVARPPLSVREQGMYQRLAQALPDHVILAQVSFSALIEAYSWRARNRFNRKYADFVVCNRAFQVVAVIELDDSSHDGRAEADAKRESLLYLTGYKVLRYRKYPDVAQIRADIASDYRRSSGGP